MNMKKVHTIAPAKLILSGEYSVVFNKVAVACAVNRYAGVSIYGRKEEGVLFHFRDIRQTVLSTVSALQRIRDRLVQNFKLFADGSLSIREVLTSPWEIFQYSLISLLDACGVELEEGLHIDVQSTIPMGCGMGSSAATAVSFLKSASCYFGLQKGVEWLEKCVFECERFQHGSPSGVDAKLALYGGCVAFQKNKPVEKLILPSSPFWLINSGTPLSKTGECVEYVKKRFEHSSIWSEFEAITQAMASYIREGRSFEDPSFLELVRANQRLLVRIGVIPKELTRCIAELEVEGVFAKVCGAGAVRGSRGGIIAAFGKVPSEKICKKYGFQPFIVHGEEHGVRVV